MPKKSSGFTLVELLVTIAIIAVLAAIGLVAYSAVLKQGRDSKRMSDLRSIQSALEQYFSDQGFYPPRWGVVPTACSTPAYNGYLLLVSSGSNCPLKSPDGLKTYINEVPKDPLGTQYCYKTLTSGEDCGVNPITCTALAHKCVSYCLFANLENQPAGSDRCDGTSTRTYNLKVIPPI